MTESMILALIGGILIGLSSTTMLGGIGRITGISGILGMSLGKIQAEHLWRYAFLGGLIVGGIGMLISNPQYFDYQLDLPPAQYIIAGLIVGYGTRLGSGCTSGHGVCGISRTAKRSIVATLVFMLFGIITVAVQRILL
ncbi:MAG: YeeE/YedE family protein [Bdellovibrionota bacterium]|nr:YeeE/YedE family protein [Bdellovibrionota bacterium]